MLFRSFPSHDTARITDELLARKTNAISGVAIKQRQEQGSLVTSLFFENLLFVGRYGK